MKHWTHGQNFQLVCYLLVGNLLACVQLTYCRDNTHCKGLGTCLLHWGHRFQVVDNQPCEISRDNLYLVYV